MATPGPEAVGDEAALNRLLLLLRERLVLLLLVDRGILHALKRLLLVIRAHLEDEGRDERNGEEDVGDVERDGVRSGLVRLELREDRDVAVRGEGLREEQVDGRFGREEEEILDEGDEDQVQDLEGDRGHIVADDWPAVVLRAPVGSQWLLVSVARPAAQVRGALGASTHGSRKPRRADW